MRKTSQTFLKVGATLGIIFGIIFAIFGAILLVIGKMEVNADYLKAFQDIIINNYNGNVQAFRNAMVGYGVYLIIAGLASIASAVLCIVCRNNHAMGVYIAAIVLCAIGDNIFGLLGAIFGLVANAQEKNANKPIDQNNAQ